jgi:hypothetical protein
MPSSSSSTLLPGTSAHFSACNRQAAVVEQKGNKDRRLHPGDEAGPGRQVRFGGNEPEVQHPGHAMEKWQNEPERGVYKWSRAIFTKRSQPVKTPRDQQVVCEARFTQHHRGALHEQREETWGRKFRLYFCNKLEAAVPRPCPGPRNREGGVDRQNEPERGDVTRFPVR